MTAVISTSRTRAFSTLRRQNSRPGSSESPILRITPFLGMSEDFAARCYNSRMQNLGTTNPAKIADQLDSTLSAALPWLRPLSEDVVTARPSPDRWTVKEVVGTGIRVRNRDGSCRPETIPEGRSLGVRIGAARPVSVLCAKCVDGFSNCAGDRSLSFESERHAPAPSLARNVGSGARVARGVCFGPVARMTIS
jgi:hypothetical protein